MDVDEIVGDQPAITLERHRPVDILGSVPLIDLGLLVEPAQVGLVAAVVMAEVCGVTRLDLVPVVHNAPPCRSYSRDGRPNAEPIQPASPVLRGRWPVGPEGERLSRRVWQFQI